MKVKVSMLIENLSRYKEEYIELEMLKIFCYPRIYDINSILECIKRKVSSGKYFCTKSDFSRITGKSRVTVDDWIKKEVLVKRGKMIDLEKSLKNLENLHKFI